MDHTLLKDRTSSFTNEPDDEEFQTVEITYVDPNSGSVCTRDVYCDRDDWKNRYQARLLVSSDLVNSLNEAVEIWAGRFKETHRRLTDSRLGYYYELWSIRGYLTRLFDFANQKEAVTQRPALDADDSVEDALDGLEPEEEDEKIVEVCPVHFFYPDMYLDAWTKDRLRIAMDSCKLALDNEILSITEKINLMGGGTWRQLLAYFLRHGHDPIEMVKDLMKAIEDPEEKKEIVNKMTDGLQDKFDELHALIEQLMAENQDQTKRQLEINLLEGKQRIEIDDILLKIKAMQKYLDAPGFVEPVQDEKAMQEEVKQAQKQLFEKNEGSIKAWTQEVRRLRALLQDWRDKISESCDANVLTQLEDEIKEWKRKIRVVDMRTESFLEQRVESDSKTEEIQEKIEEERLKCEEIRAKLGALPPPNPMALKMKRMQREINQLVAEDKKIKKALAGPSTRIKAMRMQLKMLYDKLGWDWDLSDSDDDDDWENMPYWQRRKLAANGFLPFDARDFLLQEQAFKKRRKQKLENKGKKEQKTEWVAQMKAKRVSVIGETMVPVPPAPEEEEEEVGPILFGSAPQTPRDEDEPPKAGQATLNWHSGVAAVTALIKMSKLLSNKDAATRRSTIVSTRKSLVSDNGARRSILSKKSSIVSKRATLISRGTITSAGTDDPIIRAISSARENLSSSREVSVRTPRWLQAQREEEEREQRQIELSRLLQLRESFESQLRQCVECFIDLLPTTGALADLRNRLVDTLARLHEPPSDPPVWQERQLEKDLQSISEAFQEAIEYGETVRPISAAMVHSVRFRDLRHMLEDVLLNEQKMREVLGDSLEDQQQNAHSDSESSPEPTQRSRQLLSSGSLQSSNMLDSRTFSASSKLHGASTSEELSESLRLPPRFQTTSSFFNGKSKKQFPKKVDFGFRPDGAGEDSLENWSLFKVSKGFGSTSLSGFGDTVSTSVGPTSSTCSDKFRRTETKMRRHQALFDCDFHEYMSQASQRDNSPWQTASAPSLHTSGKKNNKKSLPSLPKLIKSATRLSGAPGKPLAGIKGDGEGGWTHCPSRISVPMKKLGAITPSNALFA